MAVWHVSEVVQGKDRELRFELYDLQFFGARLMVSCHFRASRWETVKELSFKRPANDVAVGEARSILALSFLSGQDLQSWVYLRWNVRRCVDSVWIPVIAGFSFSHSPA